MIMLLKINILMNTSDYISSKSHSCFFVVGSSHFRNQTLTEVKHVQIFMKNTMKDSS
jgi:hypothetical protein